MLGGGDPVPTTVDPVNASDRRLGRSVTRIHQAERVIPETARPSLESLIVAGASMDFVSRVHGFSAALSPAAIEMFANQAGLGRQALHNVVLPALKAANVADYTLNGEGLVSGVQEYLGVTGNLIEQSYRVLLELRPSQAEFVVLHSVELASYAPLTEQQHLDQLVRRGFSEGDATTGYKLTLAAGLNKRIKSADLSEYVVYNPYVWETGQVPIAGFLRGLPPAERDALIGICEQASASPGLALPSVTGTSPQMFAAARKVGLVQAATVKSTASAGSQTYVFSPALESDDDKLVTTEALNQRKLFVAHMLFGHEKAERGGGRIMDPVVLVRALLNRGTVGPASNIRTDYHLLEAHGIVKVNETAGGRAYLELVKEEIVQGGLGWLQKSSGTPLASEPAIKLLQSPGTFSNPEQERANPADDAAANELAEAAVLRLREEVRSANRQDKPTNLRR